MALGTTFLKSHLLSLFWDTGGLSKVQTSDQDPQTMDMWEAEESLGLASKNKTNKPTNPAAASLRGGTLAKPLKIMPDFSYGCVVTEHRKTQDKV